MSFWNPFRKKDRENVAADSSAGFVPMTGDSSATDASPHGGNDTGHATSTDSGASSVGDGGGGGGGDGGGGM